jgi:agmatinase
MEFYFSNVGKFLSSSTGYEEASYVFFGAPFDGTSTYRPGSRFFPSAVREASVNIEGYSFRHNYDVERVKVHDAGDLILSTNPGEVVDSVRRVCTRIVKDGKRIIMIGGEHTVTLGASRALGEDVGLLILDAHFDVRDEYMGSAVGHASILRRMIEDRGVENIVHLGARAACEEEVGFVKKCGLKHYDSKVFQGKAQAVLKEVEREITHFEKIYVSIDMDVFDPSYAPGVGNPEPEGLTPTVVFEVLSCLEGKDVLGFDVTEGNPMLPDCGVTSILAAKTIFELISTLEKTS